MNKQYRVLIEYEDESIHPLHIIARSKEEAAELVKGRFKYSYIKILRVEEAEK